MSNVRHYGPKPTQPTKAQSLRVVRQALVDRAVPARRPDAAVRIVKAALLAGAVISISGLDPATAADVQVVREIPRVVQDAPRREALAFENLDPAIVRGYVRHVHRR